MKKTNLKLYIWTNYSPDYTSGLAFAIAESENDARKLVETERGYTIREHQWGNLEVRVLNEPVARECVGGG